VTGLLLTLALAGGAQAAQTPPTRPATPVVRPAPQTRPVYDDAADARAKIATAIKNAATDEIRVLINWGTNDDAGRAFAQALTDPVVRATRYSADEYKVVNVDVGLADKNLDVAREYGATLSARTLPALTVLDHLGKPIAQADAPVFRKADAPAAFDPTRIATFLKTHQAPAPDANAQFANALSQAKKDGRTVFVWFTAPW
jgi:hypothetical protein